MPICVTTLYLRAASVSAPCFADRARQRLLDVDVLAELHRRHRDDGVVVIGRGDDHRVDVLLLLEHLRGSPGTSPPSGTSPEVPLRRHRRLGGLALVAVAQRDDVVALATFIRFVRAHAVFVADDSDVDRVAGCLEPGAEHVARHDRDPAAAAAVPMNLRRDTPVGGSFSLLIVCSPGGPEVCIES